MALQKIKTLGNGVIGDYWQIGAMTDVKAGNNEPFTRVDIYLWKDQQTANLEGAKPLFYQFNFTVDLNVTVASLGMDYSESVRQANRNAAYNKLKRLAQDELLRPVPEQNINLVFFADAVDV